MDTFVVVQQAEDGTRRFLAPYNTPPWTTTLANAGQYARRYEAETDAREFHAAVLPWSEAHDLTFSEPGAVPA